MVERTPVRLLEPLCALIATVAAVTLIAFPTMGSPDPTDHDAELADCLARLRTAVWHYGLEHGDSDGLHHPAQDGNPATLLAQLTGRTDESGRLDNGMTTAALLYGPYLTAVPTNPSNGRETIRVAHEESAEELEAQGTAGWVYWPETGTIKADHGYWPNPVDARNNAANH